MHVDRESLVAGQQGPARDRGPNLRLSGDDALSLALLEQPVLTLVATDLDGLETVQTVRDLDARPTARDLVHEISVPERLASLRVVL